MSSNYIYLQDSDAASFWFVFQLLPPLFSELWTSLTTYPAHCSYVLCWSHSMKSTRGSEGGKKRLGPGLAVWHLSALYPQSWSGSSPLQTLTCQLLFVSSNRGVTGSLIFWTPGDHSIYPWELSFLSPVWSSPFIKVWASCFLSLQKREEICWRRSLTVTLNSSWPHFGTSLPDQMAQVNPLCTVCGQNADTGNTAEGGKMTVYQAYKWALEVFLSPPGGTMGCISLVSLRITEAVSERWGSCERPHD